ncbi:hypothetical protein Btru_072410 [Bulinus truncatus]|nr:hypothetical protein Btru_072410 [Bulinus truncatus]
MGSLRSTKEKCKICGSLCKTLLLNNKISKDVESLFLTPTEQLKSCLNKIEQAAEFQKNHQKRLVKQHRMRIKGLQSQLMSYQKAIKQAQSMERDYQYRFQQTYSSLCKKGVFLSFEMVVLPTPELPAAELQVCNNNMSGWLHCNGCLCSPEHNLKFYLTNCSHIFCQNCVQSCTKEKCKICGSLCKTLLLNNKISKDVESLFLTPTEQLKSCLNKIEQAAEFQKNHQKRLVKQHRMRIKGLQSQLMSYQKAIKQAQSMERELIRLKSENEYLKLILSKKDSHPRCKNGISPGAFSASPGAAVCERAQHCGYNIPRKLGVPPSDFKWRTPTQGVTQSVGCTPTRFDPRGYPLSIPRPIVFPKSS